MSPNHPPRMGSWIAEIWVSAVALLIFALEIPLLALFTALGWTYLNPMLTQRFLARFIQRAERAWGC